MSLSQNRPKQTNSLLLDLLGHIAVLKVPYYLLNFNCRYNSVKILQVLRQDTIGFITFNENSSMKDLLQGIHTSQANLASYYSIDCSDRKFETENFIGNFVAREEVPKCFCHLHIQ